MDGRTESSQLPEMSSPPTVGEHRTAGENALAERGPDAGSHEPVAVPRQRWRLGLARSSRAPAAVGRELMDAWEIALDRATLPLLRVGRGPARITFGAPLPASMEAEHELAEVVLSERCEIWRVREGLASALPDGWRLVSIEDVWLGTPSLTGSVAAADYRIELGVAGPDADGSGTGLVTAGHSTPAASSIEELIVAGASALLRAPRLSRRRAKGGGTVEYDLRPLLLDVGVVDTGPPVVIRTRTRLHPSLGSGRPEEVVSALADEVGITLVAVSVVRERIVLADDLA